jgi:hypothetical protein
MLANGCTEVACVDACKDALERCKTGLPGHLTGGVLSERDCETRCEENAGAWCECFDCINEDESCSIRCQRDESCVEPFRGSMVDG